MEWDNHDLEDISAVRVLPADEQTPSSGAKLLEVNYDGQEWCSQESGYLEWEGTPGSEVSTSILSPLQEKR